MIGPEGAAMRVADRLRDRVPVRLAAREAALDLEPGALGTPALVAAYDKLRLAIEEWPAILVVGQALRRLGASELAEGGIRSYRARYALRVLVWVRGEDEVDTDLRRKRYLLATREALLELAVAVDVEVDPLSIAESYSDIVLDDAGATIAGAWVDVDVLIEERLEPAPGAPVRRVDAIDLVTTTITRDTATLPPHPGL